MNVFNRRLFSPAFESSLKRTRELGRSYGIAVVAVAAAVVARLAVDPIAHEKGPFLFFAFAIVAASLYGGLRAGVTAVIFSLVAGDYLFIEPRYTFFIFDTFGDSVLLALFCALGVALSLLVERLNRATEKLRRSQTQLTRTNDLLLARQRDLETA